MGAAIVRRRIELAGYEQGDDRNCGDRPDKAGRKTSWLLSH
jgi:hypothetical protein